MDDIDIRRLSDEIAYLRSLLDANGIAYDYEAFARVREETEVGDRSLKVKIAPVEMMSAEMMSAEKVNVGMASGEIVPAEKPSVKMMPMEKASVKMVPLEIIAETAKFFFSMFHGRVDVYATRSKNKIYHPKCENFWRLGLCRKRDGEKVKCSECENRVWASLNSQVLMRHLKGESEDCTDVVGIYVMLPDETCRFIVFDFDNHDENATVSNDWQDEVDALREICAVNGIDALVERSRSGNGAHVWIFFSEAVPAVQARRFGNALITKGAESVSLRNFLYYDRMMPMQDTLPEGGLGNLIALPLQGQAVKNGNSVFVDEHWRPYPDQWQKLHSVRKLSLEQIETYIKEWCPDDKPYGVLQGEENEEERDLFSSTSKRGIQRSDAADGKVMITLKDGLYVEKNGLKPRLQNAIRRLAAYSNPDFYKKLALGFSTQEIPRIVYCGYDEGDNIVIPRGCQKALLDALTDAGLDYEIIDRRQSGRPLNVSFDGALYPEQLTAANALLCNENGVLGAATAFGKTVVGAYLIAHRKVNTLILVNSVEIMKNWEADLNRFLTIDEPLPTYVTPIGRIKQRKSLIGSFSSQKDALTGIVDIAMITSLGKDDNVNPLVKNYGMVIMDECHHAAAYTSESVLRALTAKYVYGLTATPKRDDGQEKKIFMQLGPIRHRYTAKDRAQKQGIGHFVYPRFTRLVDASDDDLTISEAFNLVISSDIRNKQIVSDAIDCLKKGRTPIVMTKRKEHAARLYEMLQGAAQHVFLLQGGGGMKEREALRIQLFAVPKDETLLVVAIGQYIGEGFNYPRLDTLLLAMPISFENNVEQYAGRLNRDYEGKKDVIILDYIDQYVPMLERMYHKRLRTYKRIGFEICSQLVDSQMVMQSIFDAGNYEKAFSSDLAAAKSEIVICSPRLGSRKVWGFVRAVASLQERGVKVVVMTMPSSSYPEEVALRQEKLVAVMRSVGIMVNLSPSCREHFAVIDRSLVWYGSMNLLSRERDDDSLMRIESMEIAQELLEKSVATSLSARAEQN